MEAPQHFVVIDDDSLSNLVSQYTILRCAPQATISLFNEPEEALDFFKSYSINKQDGHPVIMFLDINMPSMSGWEFLESFELLGEKIQKHFKIYMLTSSIDSSDKERAASHPLVQGFIPKPLSVGSVEKVLEDYKDKVSSNEPV